MAEGYRAVMRIILLHQHMAVEASHLRNREDADGSKGPGRYRKHLALGHIGAQPAVCRALQTVEGDVSRNDVSLQGSLGHFLRKASGHDELILHGAGGQLAGAGVAAVEAHEGILLGIREFARDVLVVEIRRNGVVNIEQGHSVLAYAGADELA